MRHFITTQDWSSPEIDALLQGARELKRSPLRPLLREKSIALIFFNNSLRTRCSFELGMHQLGGYALVLEPGKSAWPLEFDFGAVMDGNAEEHVAEAARVLSRYCDLIAVRAFPGFVDWSRDREDRVIRAFAEYATVPVINMETITHPCQELAHAMTLRERLGDDLRGRKYLLTWTYHPKGLNTAVANSAALIATKLGMDVTLLCPEPAFLLDERYLEFARTNAERSGGSFRVTHDIAAGYDGAEVVYAKSWGALPYFGRWDEEVQVRGKYRDFIVDEAKMARTDNALFGHCLPCRRNVKVTDAVIDSPQSIVIDEAENRLHVQKSVMCHLLDVPVEVT